MEKVCFRPSRLGEMLVLGMAGEACVGKWSADGAVSANLIGPLPKSFEFVFRTIKVLNSCTVQECQQIESDQEETVPMIS